MNEDEAKRFREEGPIANNTNSIGAFEIETNLTSGRDEEHDDGDGDGSGDESSDRGSLQDGHDNCGPGRRTLDDFLEAGFQASKESALSSVLPRSSSVPSTSSWYHSIAYNDTGTSTEFHSRSSCVSLVAFNRQWRYWCIILSLGVANCSDATELLCISYILGDPFFRSEMLKNDEGGGSGLLAAAIFVGMLLGGLLVGAMGDWAGRKPMLLLGLLCNCMAGIASALAPNVYVLALLRCIAGVGIGATIPPLFALATELAPPSVRGVCVSICAGFWTVASIFVALTAMWCFERSEAGANTWRLFAFLCAVPSALGSILVYRMVPESPRFLGLEGRSQDALDIANALVEKMNGSDGNGGTSLPVPPLTISELEGTFPSSSGRELDDQLQNDSDWFESEGAGYPQRSLELLRRTVSDWLRSSSLLFAPNLKQTTRPLLLVWFCLSYGTYGMMIWINVIFQKVHLENVYFNALLFAMATVPGITLSALSLDKLGRAVSLSGSIVCASASLVLFASSAVNTHSTGIVVSACLFQCFQIVTWSTLDTMTSELFPTSVRATGLGVCAAFGKTGGLLAQFVNESLMDNPVQLLLVTAGTLLMGALTPCLLPGGGELTGQPVQDDLGSIQIPTMLPTSPHSHSSGESGFTDHPSPSGKHPHRGSGNIVHRPTRRWCSSDDEG